MTRTISDARIRRCLIDSGASPELVSYLIAAPTRPSDLAGTLKWGIVLSTTATAIILIGNMGLEETVQGIGIATLGAGLGLLIFYPVGVWERRRVEREKAVGAGGLP